ncbi:hypothetical protein ACIROD_16325 [Peribacillus sp. NPDC101481]
MVNEKVKLMMIISSPKTWLKKRKKHPMQRNDGYVGIKENQKVEGIQ